MVAYTENPYHFIDPVKLTDEAVLALSSLQRGLKVPDELLDEGIKLCDYLIFLLQELKAEKLDVQASHSPYRDYRALKESKIDIDKESKKTNEVKTWIKELIRDPSSHTGDDIEQIKEYLITMTLPMWEHRTSEFLEKKMKRSLIIRG